MPKPPTRTYCDVDDDEAADADSNRHRSQGSALRTMCSSPEVEMRSVEHRRQARNSDDLPDEEESSLLRNGSPRSDAPFSPQSSRGPWSPSLSRDLAVCGAAWRRLSCPTRSVLLLAAGALLLFATYELGIGEGAREQGRDDAENAAAGKSLKIFSGKGVAGSIPPTDAAKNAGAHSAHDDLNVAQHPGEKAPSKLITKEKLARIRDSSRTLIDALDEYYGGEQKAKAMLAKSWQVHWQLDGEYEFLDANRGGEGDMEDDDDDNVPGEDGEHDGVASGNDNDAVDGDASGIDNNDADGDASGNDSDAEDGGASGAIAEDSRGDDRGLRRAKSRKRKDKEGNEEVGTDEKRPKAEKKKKNKGVKVGKIIEVLEDMSPEELARHHHFRRERTTKLVETMARAILNPHQDKFIVGTIGSSVAAGHDNCHYDAYESQLERTLAPVFAAADMELEVQNAGEGGGCGDDHQNQVFCITHNLSPDVDIIHYSWTYFEKSNPEVQREQLVRWAQRMHRRPMVHHLVARGKKNTCSGDVIANVELAKRYAIYGYNAFCIQTGLYFGGHDYDADAEAGVNRFAWKFVGDGYHNTTRYGEELPDDDPRKASLGTVFRNWHPGPLGFQIASDAFAYVYTRGLMIALDIIEEDINAGVDPMDRWFRRRLRSEGMKDDESSRELQVVSPDNEPLEQRRLHQLPPLGDLPEPLFCDPLYCSTPHPPSCLNFEKPTFGTPGISIQSQSDWQIWNEKNKWNYMVGKVDTKIIKAMDSEEWRKKCTHLDACGGIVAQNSTSGTLTFELPSSEMTAGLVFICGCCGKHVGQTMFIDNQNVVIKLNGRALDKSKMDVFPNNKCARLLNRFGEGGFEHEERLVLSIEMAKDPNLGPDEEPSAVKISHIVAL